ncbi:RadC family protein [Mangrovivirga cuniculi]|uniref:MPN domain-containing protein n=1 Tax=Mangrovivirga cuniculi TaxID=2715131 RepID=A0A4D7JMP8_9BACT|nr:DNA repair protein RadC [Mangrovivirga cuniculi]QCK13922.1 hypothetical protein DCC35_03695 [Mangrovivirga cuniculi]
MNTHLNIRSWAEEDRPREKLLTKGKSTLSDAELLAILIGSGTRSMSAVDLCKQILHHNDNDLNKIARMTVSELMRFKGIGEAKAISIVSALELGRRRKPEGKNISRITCSTDAYNILSPLMRDLPHEEFWVILLNRQNGVIKSIKTSSGGVSGTVVDPKIVFKMAIDHTASGVILSHNHPSGNLKPSQADLQLTRKIKEAGLLLEVPVLDHLIITNNGYFSMADEGVL